MTASPGTKVSSTGSSQVPRPAKLTDLYRWMGLEAPIETGKDLRRGLDPWRLRPRSPGLIEVYGKRLPLRLPRGRLLGRVMVASEQLTIGELAAATRSVVVRTRCTHRCHQ